MSDKKPLCGRYIGDNDGTCPQLTCVRDADHLGDCDNVRGDDPLGELPKAKRGAADWSESDAELARVLGSLPQAEPRPLRAPPLRLPAEIAERAAIEDAAAMYAEHGVRWAAQLDEISEIANQCAGVRDVVGVVERIRALKARLDEVERDLLLARSEIAHKTGQIEGLTEQGRRNLEALKNAERLLGRAEPPVTFEGPQLDARTCVVLATRAKADAFRGETWSRLAPKDLFKLAEAAARSLVTPREEPTPHTCADGRECGACIDERDRRDRAKDDLDRALSAAVTRAAYETRAGEWGQKIDAARCAVWLKFLTDEFIDRAQKHFAATVEGIASHAAGADRRIDELEAENKALRAKCAAKRE